MNSAVTSRDRRAINLVFKTHLDIGFTDHAEKVRRLYHERFIPQAIETGEHFWHEDPNQTLFVWTTGAWLIWDHLNSQDAARVARLEQAIARGTIRWHALPFTTHSELMSPSLFEAGLSFAQELDARFGVRTRAAKMTDVPGHTLGIVPLMAKAGIRFLHIGVNGASPVPDVPDLFRWQAPDGSEVLVMYQDSYGATHFPAGMSTGLSFAHTQDNVGPQTVSQTMDVHRALARENPGLDIKAGTLDDYGDMLWARRADLPVVDREIGDSWIHGAGSDPVKLARFVALRRLYDRFAAENLTPQRKAFGRGLTLVAEHTWGVDIKTYLRDETAWDRPAFEAARLSDPRFAFSEASWAEQRAYLDQAIAMLDPPDRALATAAKALPQIQKADDVSAVTIEAGIDILLGDWSIAIDPSTGDIVRLAHRHLEAEAPSLMGFRYDSYDAADVEAHMRTYLTNRVDWAVLDHAKPGLETASTARSERWMPQLTSAQRSGDMLILHLSLPAIATKTLGAPQAVTLTLSPVPEGLAIAYALTGKPANRMPEAAFVTLTPGGAMDWSVRKLGLWLQPDRGVRRGGGQLQAVDAVRAVLPRAHMQVVAHDTPLLAPAASPFMPFNSEHPDYAGGVRFNLWNNKWGTNFPMWWEGDLTARFTLSLRG